MNISMRNLLFSFLISFYALGQIPKVLSYQGYLTDANSIPRHGTFIITFKLYDAPSGGNLLWSEVDKSVNIEKGFFATLLGSPTSFGTLSFDKQYYLSLTPQGESEITPRIPLTSTAYSFNAVTVSDGAITNPKISDNAVTVTKLSDNSVTSSKISNSTIAKEDLAVNVISAMLPVGTIISSMLNPSQFNTEMGTTTSWVPCDGRSVASSDYASLVGSNVPNLNGMFLRGTGSQTVSVSIGGNITYDGGSAGVFQEDKVLEHGHQFWFGDDSSPAGGLNYPRMSTRTNSPNIDLGSPVRGLSGFFRNASENKPASVSVNYYIKINR